MIYLMHQELHSRKRILLEETCNEGEWLVKAATRSQFIGLGPTGIHTGETLFNTAQPVSYEVVQR
jgi:hypothetical protein